jgi:hypothetical protein
LKQPVPHPQAGSQHPPQPHVGSQQLPQPQPHDCSQPQPPPQPPQQFRGLHPQLCRPQQSNPNSPKMPPPSASEVVGKIEIAATTARAVKKLRISRIPQRYARKGNGGAIEPAPDKFPPDAAYAMTAQ